MPCERIEPLILGFRVGAHRVGESLRPPTSPIVHEEQVLSEEVSMELRFSDLEASTSGVMGVAPTDTVERAVTLMALHNFSQLPVLSGPRSLRGVISWKSLGEARLHSDPTEVRECMCAPNVVALTSPVLPELTSISTHDYILVQDRVATVSGIVTAADMTLEFGLLAKPFLLLGEVERRLRDLIARGGEPSELLRDLVLQGGRAPSSFEEMTLGELERAFERPAIWQKLGIDLDRSEFVKSLTGVRKLRNQMVHFRDDVPDPTSLQALESFARVLRLIG